jgi:hypothetical protein
MARAVSGEVCGRRRKMTDGWGPLSVREGEGVGYRFGKWLSGPRAHFCSGSNRCPLALSYFQFLFSFLFLFSISSITFANLVQIASNRLCKVYKIPSNSNKHVFTTKTRFLIKRS